MMDQSSSNHSSSLQASLRQSLQSKLDYASMPPVYKIPLYELDFYMYNEVKRKYPQAVHLREAIQHEREMQDADVILLFAIRQVG